MWFADGWFFLSGGITHASFGGIGMAYYFGANPLLGALIFAILSAWGIETFTSRKQIREDSAIGLIWSLGMAIGIIFIYLTPGYAPNLMSFLFWKHSECHLHRHYLDGHC